MRRAVTLLLAAATLISGQTAAHHSRAGFDTDTVAAVQGKVVGFTWSNPHVYIEVEADNAAAGDERWVIETDAIPILLRSGWTADSLKIGEPVRARLNPGKAGREHHGLLVSIAKQDGSVLLPRAHFERDLAPARQQSREPTLAGVWELPFGETGDFMRRWGTTPLTEKAQAAKAAFGPEDRPAGDCIETPTPMIMAMPYLNEVELHDDRVLLRNEFFDVERVVYLDGREHPADGSPTMQGHSIGWWEDDVLVVDTRLLAEHRAPIRGPNEGVPGGVQRHVIERYRVSEDGLRVSIDVVVEDPEYLAAPFEGTLEWAFVPDFELSSFTCTP